MALSLVWFTADLYEHKGEEKMLGKVRLVLLVVAPQTLCNTLLCTKLGQFQCTFT